MSTTAQGLQSRGIILVHASAVQVDGGAWIFLGPSGAGKSTIRRLLSALAQPVGDDAVYLIPQLGGGWAVTDASSYRMAAGEPESAGLEKASLRGILRLYQAPSPRLERIHALDTCRHLAEAFFFFFRLYEQEDWSIERRKSTFTSLAEIARSIPGYHLYFSRSPRTAELLSKELIL